MVPRTELSITVAFGRITKFTDGMIAELQKDAASVGSEILLYNIGDDMARFLEDSLMATASRTSARRRRGPHGLGSRRTT